MTSVSCTAISADLIYGLLDVFNVPTGHGLTAQPIASIAVADIAKPKGFK
jgi:hypothetical protein